MYEKFYGLQENPFNVTCDPDFFFPSAHHEEAFSHLVFGIKQRKGILVITGEIGTGKTTLCRTLISRLEENIKTALILNPYFSEAQLLRMIVEDLGISGSFRNKLDLTRALNTFLLEQSGLGNNVVVIIDEAQNLTPRQLEQIRLLSNLETQKNKLLQIILVGQPELLDKLKLAALRQLNQRISVRYHMLPLKRDELESYIQHRLDVASVARDAGLAPSITAEAYDAIYHFSRGTPRLINILCDRVLLNGFVNETRTIDRQGICKCAKETG